MVANIATYLLCARGNMAQLPKYENVPLKTPPVCNCDPDALLSHTAIQLSLILRFF